MKTATPPYRITLRDTAVYLACMTIFGAAYYTTLWFNRGGNIHRNDPYLSLIGFLNWGGVDYLLKTLLSVPVIWLMFIRLADTAIYKRLLLHVLILPAFVICWQYLYYALTEQLGLYHLSGDGSVWDIYIPGLFYVLEFSALHAYFYFREAQAKERAAAELREAALKSELTAIKAQLNPHFLYNVFNTINASLPPGQEQTRQMIGELSDLFRYQLQASKSETVPLRDELDFTRKYLDLEKARFQDRLKVVFDVDESLLDEQVPPMLLQPLVENAVKHGIAPLVEGGMISITVAKVNGKLSFRVVDTGAGVKDKGAMVGKGTGLTNTAIRLEKMFGASLDFSDNQPSGLAVQFSAG